MNHKENTNYMDVAEKLYYYLNPNTKMNVPNSAYILTERWYSEWLNTDTNLPLFEWCIKNKN